MIGELDLYGIFVPGFLVWMLAAFALSVMVRRVLDRCGVYRLVWHRPLFDVALYVVLVAGVVMVVSRLVS